MALTDSQKRFLDRLVGSLMRREDPLVKANLPKFTDIIGQVAGLHDPFVLTGAMMYNDAQGTPYFPSVEQTSPWITPGIVQMKNGDRIELKNESMIATVLTPSGQPFAYPGDNTWCEVAVGVFVGEREGWLDQDGIPQPAQWSYGFIYGDATPYAPATQPPPVSDAQILSALRAGPWDGYPDREAVGFCKLGKLRVAFVGGDDAFYMVGIDNRFRDF